VAERLSTASRQPSNVQPDEGAGVSPPSDAVFGDPVLATAILDALLRRSQVATIRGDSPRQREKRRAVLVPDHAVSMPSEGGGKHKIQGGQSLAPPPRGVSFGCRWDTNVGRGWPALVPRKNAQLSIWGATDHRDALFLGIGPSGAITSRRSHDQGARSQSAAVPRILRSAGFAEGKDAR
jgi:hypothetical protein